MILRAIAPVTAGRYILRHRQRTLSRVSTQRERAIQAKEFGLQYLVYECEVDLQTFREWRDLETRQTAR